MPSLKVLPYPADRRKVPVQAGGDMVEETLTLPVSAANMQTTPEYFVWEAPGKPVTVHLDFDTLDRLSKEIMRGFGVVPRRSVEVGGILLGTAERTADGTRWTVRIEDFEPVPCRHTRGLSYQLSDEEMVRFSDTVAQWEPQAGRQTYAVGFYRSHTREGLGLTEEDQRMYQEFFPEASGVALLVKPFATRASVGAFFIRENGQIRSQSSYQEFPFRRRELGGEPEIEEESATSEDKGEGTGGESEMASGTFTAPAAPQSAPRERQRFSDEGPVAPALPSGTGRKLKREWLWIPLSFIFLLLGVVLGISVTLSWQTKLPTGDPYTLNLSVTPTGNSVQVRWDQNSPAIQSALRGDLVIEDGGRTKTVPLDTGLLRNGTIIYNRASGDLKFRLEVNARDRVQVSESLTLNLDQNSAAQ